LLAISVAVRLLLVLLLLVCLALILVAVFLNGAFHLRRLQTHSTPALILSFITLLIAVSYVTTQVVTWYYTGGYHFGIIKWLSRHGAVPGLALLYYGFGYTSSWFALAASFNDWILDGRLSVLSGGFAFLMLVLHLWLCLTRIFADRAKGEDWFV